MGRSSERGPSSAAAFGTPLQKRPRAGYNARLAAVSSRGLGHSPLKAGTRVRIPLPLFARTGRLDMVGGVAARRRPHRLSVRTRPFQGRETGSTPVGAITAARGRSWAVRDRSPRASEVSDEEQCSGRAKVVQEKCSGSAGNLRRTALAQPEPRRSQDETRTECRNWGCSSAG